MVNINPKTQLARIKIAWKLGGLMRAHRKTYTVLLRERGKLMHLERAIASTAGKINGVEKHIMELEKRMSRISELERYLHPAKKPKGRPRRRG